MIELSTNEMISKKGHVWEEVETINLLKPSGNFTYRQV
jgi:hypothetical protein